MSTATIHIETEKRSAERSGSKLVPDLRFKEFDDPWYKDILKTRIDSIDSGWSPQCEDYPALNEEWGVLKTTAVVWEGFNQNANKKLPEPLEPRPNLQVVKGDILITRAGPTSRVGVTVYVNDVRSKLMLSDKLIRLKVNDSTSSLFLSISLGNREVQKQLVSKSSGLAESQTNISQKILLNTKLLFPKFPEQQKIASFLSAVDEKIQQLTKKKALLEQYKKGVMQQLFHSAGSGQASGQLRFNDENGNSYPDWEEKRLGEIGEFKTSSVDKKIVEGETLVKLVNYMNVYRHEEILPDNIENLMVVSAKTNQLETSDLKKGDVLFTPSSETSDDIGHSVVIFKDLPNTLYSYHLMRFRPSIKLDLMYSHFFCNTADVLRQISRFATGSTRFTISVGNFSAVKLSIPCFEEQQKIATYLSSIDTKIEAVNNQITQTQTFKKGLLQQMFV